jgi:hypothetical protein
MRIVFGVGTRLFIWETSVSRVAMRTTGDSDEECDDDFKPAPPMDPHGTLSSHCEISPQAIYGEVNVRRFGFHGGKEPGGEENS